jgi:hypothetical protein
MKNRFFLKFGHQHWVRSSKSLAFKLSLSIACLSLTLLVFYNKSGRFETRKNGSPKIYALSDDKIVV